MTFRLLTLAMRLCRWAGGLLYRAADWFQWRATAALMREINRKRF